MLPASRVNYLVGVLHSSGDGKTPSSEEVKYHVLLREERMDSLPITITFNGMWAIASDDSTISNNRNVSLCYHSQDGILLLWCEE